MDDRMTEVHGEKVEIVVTERPRSGQVRVAVLGRCSRSRRVNQSWMNVRDVDSTIVQFCPLSVSGLCPERDDRGEVDDEQKRLVAPHVVDGHPYAVQRTLNTAWHGTGMKRHSNHRPHEQTL